MQITHQAVVLPYSEFAIDFLVHLRKAGRKPLVYDACVLISALKCMFDLHRQSQNELVQERSQCDGIREELERY
jgi:hypothetical protein